MGEPIRVSGSCRSTFIKVRVESPWIHVSVWEFARC